MATLGLLVDVVLVPILFAATAIVCERWRRSKLRPWQIGLGTMLGLMSIVIVLTWYHWHERDTYYWLRGTDELEVNMFQYLHPDDDAQPWNWAFPWYIAAPLLFAEGCGLYVAGILTFHVARRLRSVRLPADVAGAKPCR